MTLAPRREWLALATFDEAEGPRPFWRPTKESAREAAALARDCGAYDIRVLSPAAQLRLWRAESWSGRLAQVLREAIVSTSPGRPVAVGRKPRPFARVAAAWIYLLKRRDRQRPGLPCEGRTLFDEGGER